MKQLTDKQRLDWLEQQIVNIRAPLMWGSRLLFECQPVDADGETLPSDLRSRIDAVLKRPDKETA